MGFLIHSSKTINQSAILYTERNFSPPKSSLPVTTNIHCQPEESDRSVWVLDLSVSSYLSFSAISADYLLELWDDILLFYINVFLKLFMFGEFFYTHLLFCLRTMSIFITWVWVLYILTFCIQCPFSGEPSSFYTGSFLLISPYGFRISFILLQAY